MDATDSMHNITTIFPGRATFVSPEEPLFRLLYLILVSVATAVGNLLVIVSVLRFKSLRRATNIMLGSLALADLLVGTVTVPLYIAWTLKPGVFDRSMLLCGCVLLSCLLVVTASQLSLMILSLEQYLAVCHPFRHRELLIRHPWLNIASAISTWVISFLTTALSSFAFKKDSKTCNYYGTFDKNFLFVASILGIFIPFVLIIVLNIKVLCVVKEQDKNESFTGGRHCGRRRFSSISFNHNSRNESNSDIPRYERRLKSSSTSNKSSPDIIRSVKISSGNTHSYTNNIESDRNSRQKMGASGLYMPQKTSKRRRQKFRYVSTEADLTGRSQSVLCEVPESKVEFYAGNDVSGDDVLEMMSPEFGSCSTGDSPSSSYASGESDVTGTFFSYDTGALVDNIMRTGPSNSVANCQSNHFTNVSTVVHEDEKNFGSIVLSGYVPGKGAESNLSSSADLVPMLQASSDTSESKLYPNMLRRSHNNSDDSITKKGSAVTRYRKQEVTFLQRPDPNQLQKNGFGVRLIHSFSESECLTGLSQDERDTEQNTLLHSQTTADLETDNISQTGDGSENNQAKCGDPRGQDVSASLIMKQDSTDCHRKASVGSQSSLRRFLPWMGRKFNSVSGLVGRNRLDSGPNAVRALRMSSVSLPLQLQRNRKDTSIGGMEPKQTTIRVSRRVTKTVALVCASFILAWFPFFIVIIINTFCKKCHLAYFLNAVVMIAFTKSVSNPIIYALCHVSFRRAYSRMLASLCLLRSSSSSGHHQFSHDGRRKS